MQPALSSITISEIFSLSSAAQRLCILYIITAIIKSSTFANIVVFLKSLVVCLCLSGFQTYLSTAPGYDFIRYRQMVHEVTQAFSSISQQIIDIQNELSKRQSMTHLATCIGNFQGLEETKLELVNFVFAVVSCIWPGVRGNIARTAL